MTDQLKQDAQQALEALETCREDEWHSEDDFGMEQTYDEDKVAKALTALRTTLKHAAHNKQVDNALRIAIEAAWDKLDDKPVACRFCHSKKGCWTWQCYHCGEIDDVQQPAPPNREWVELTEDEIKGTWAQLWYDLTHGKLSTPDNEVRNNVVMFGQALEAKLKEKNNG